MKARMEFCTIRYLFRYVSREAVSQIYKLYVNGIIGIQRLTKLRNEISTLNEHKFRHNSDCLAPICNCGEAIEDNQHKILHCPLFDSLRKGLFGRLENKTNLNASYMNSKSLCIQLLFGSSDLDVNTNEMIMKETILFTVNKKQV